MWYLERIDPLPSLLGENVISFVGAGGKTSLAEYLGHAAAARGMRVVMTTTTRIWAEVPYVTFDDRRLENGRGRRFVRIGKSVDQGKLTGLSAGEVAALGRDYDLVLVEADGAKGRPLKYPAAYEPVIPACSRRTVVVAGLDALGRTIAETVFRSEQFIQATGLPSGAEITTPVFLRLFEGDGLMKGVDRARCVVVLNKLDACGDRESVPGLAVAVSRHTGGSPVIVASVRLGEFYRVASSDGPV
jgi:probable selenium-dependent hydroxylase accessory protein YqeC